MRTNALNLHLTLILLTASAAVTAEPSAEMFAYTCAGCHGTDGSSVGPSSPHIAGINKEYFIESMQDYKLDKRNPTIMNRIAKAYSDEQIAGMADFFAKQTLRRSAQQFDSAKAELGAKYHAEYCEKCHEDGGRGESDGGTLAGQWVPYLRYTMDDYRTGARDMTRKMRKKLEKMEKAHGEGSVEDLIQYYASQK